MTRPRLVCLVSGLLFEAVLGAANLRASGLVVLFFLVNGCAVAFDKVVLEPRKSIV